MFALSFFFFWTQKRGCLWALSHLGSNLDFLVRRGGIKLKGRKEKEEEEGGLVVGDAIET